MEAVFMKLVNLSITASWLVLMILLVRLIFRKAPKWIIVLLWGLVALRLACPFSIESVFSLIPSGEPLPQSMISGAKPMVDAGIPPSTPEMAPVLPETMAPAVGAAGTSTPLWLTALTWIWLIGLIAMLSYAFLSYFLLKRRMATATRLRDHIKQSEQVESPFVLGLFRPTIYLPYTIEAVDMVHVIAHEQAHIKRRDHWWKPLGFLLLSVYWFNPVLWVAYILLCRDIESACDEKVIREMGKVDRQAYSMALLNCAVHRRRIAACPLAFGEVSVKDRIKNVMYYKEPTFWIVLLSLLMCAVLSVCFLTNPVKLTFDFDAVPIDHVITQYSPTAEAASSEHIKRLDQEQTEELQARLLGMTGAKRTVRYHHAGTIASIDIVLSNGHDIYIQSLEDGVLQLQYDSKIFRVEDEAFHQYVKALCSEAGESAPAVTWTFSPMMSAIFHVAFCFDFDVGDEYVRVEAVCENGALWNPEAEGQPRGKALAFAAGEPVCWTPDAGEGLENPTAQDSVQFTIYNGGELLYAGTLEIKKTGTAGTDGMQSIYEARLSGTDLLTLQQQEGNGGALVTLSDRAAIVAFSDLNHNHINERVVVRRLIPDESYELAVYENTEELWSMEAGIPHAGWNTIMLYNEDGQDYLVQYTPSLFQGVGSYQCVMFSLEGGKQTIKENWSVEFDVGNGDPGSVVETPEMAEFARKMNILLRNSVVLLSTEQGILTNQFTLAYELPWLYPVRFDPAAIQAAMDGRGDEEPLTSDAVSFPDAPVDLVFSSGAGAWGTVLTLNPDGSFSGEYSDTDMGGDLPTRYVCNFSGQFAPVRQINDHAFSMKLEELQTEQPEGKTWIEDGMRCIASEPYGLAGSEDFLLYAPGTLADSLPTACLDWWPDAWLWRSGKVETLSGWSLCSPNTGYGFYQWPGENASGQALTVPAEGAYRYKKAISPAIFYADESEAPFVFIDKDTVRLFFPHWDVYSPWSSGGRHAGHFRQYAFDPSGPAKDGMQLLTDTGIDTETIRSCHRYPIREGELELLLADTDAGKEIWLAEWWKSDLPYVYQIEPSDRYQLQVEYGNGEPTATMLDLAAPPILNLSDPTLSKKDVLAELRRCAKKDDRIVAAKYDEQDGGKTVYRVFEYQNEQLRSWVEYCFYDSKSDYQSFRGSVLRDNGECHNRLRLTKACHGYEVMLQANLCGKTMDGMKSALERVGFQIIT